MFYSTRLRASVRRMEWLIVIVGGLVAAFAVMEAKAPERLRAVERGLARTDAGLATVGSGLNRVSFVLIAVVTLPLLGFLLFGWVGALVGLVIGLLLTGRD